MRVHFLTNKVNRFQVISWGVSGLVLGGAYLISGSIWVPIVLHHATDRTNVMFFNITGQSSLSAISPALSEQQRAVYRSVYTASPSRRSCYCFTARWRLS